MLPLGPLLDTILPPRSVALKPGTAVAPPVEPDSESPITKETAPTIPLPKHFRCRIGVTWTNLRCYESSRPHLPRHRSGHHWPRGLHQPPARPHGEPTKWRLSPYTGVVSPDKRRRFFVVSAGYQCLSAQNGWHGGCYHLSSGSSLCGGLRCGSLMIGK